jgi:hypothetical protein
MTRRVPQDWPQYAKRISVKVLKKEATNSVFNLVNINQLVEIGLVPKYVCMLAPLLIHCNHIDHLWLHK